MEKCLCIWNKTNRILCEYVYSAYIISLHEAEGKKMFAPIESIKYEK